jgi:hypothetical protein
MASANRKLSTYCRIFQWIEAQDLQFANAIKQLCLEGHLSPKGANSAGVTFLYPSDDKFRNSITEMAYSGTDADVDEAVNLIQSLIIPDSIRSASDFNRADHPVGNKLGVKFNFAKNDGQNKVTLDSGAVLEFVSDFKLIKSRSGQIAIWRLLQGRPPTSGTKYTAPPPLKKGGACDKYLVRGSVDNSRTKLAHTVEDAFKSSMTADRATSSNPYVAKMAGLKNYLKLNHPKLLTALTPLDDESAFIAFYTWIEPYKAQGPYMIDDNVLFGPGAWNGAEIYGDAVADYFEPIKTMSRAGAGADTPAAPAIFRNYAAVAAAVNQVRASITAINNPRGLPAAVTAAYDILTKNNTIGQLKHIYPSSTLQLIKETGKKMWLDQFRHVFHIEYTAMRTANPFSPDQFDCLIRNIREKWTGDNYLKEAVLTTSCRDNVAPRTELMLAAAFVSSSDFMATPRVAITGGSRDRSQWGGGIDPRILKLNEMKSITGMVRPEGVSAGALHELRNYASRHGGALPPAVVAMRGVN